MPALPVLEIQGDSFQINVDNVNSVLNKALHLPIVNVSINGKSREGKSYLLNYFIRYLKNNGNHGWFEDILEDEEMFPWRSGSHRVTLGINIWSDPFIHNLNGKRVAIILLDCQGLFDEYTTQQQNAAIFSLSCLLSSNMIYNVKNKVDDELLQKIDLFSDYTKALSILSPNHEDTRPSFLFLVRDFEFITEFDFGFHTRSEQPEPSRDCCGNYYTRVFTTSASMPNETRVVRENFEECFREVKMFLMPYPGTNFVTNSDTQPKIKFRNLLEDFVLETVTNFVTKRLGQEEVTGEVLKSYIEMWADLCQNGSFPESSTIKELTAQLQNERAINMAMDGFKNQIRDFLSSIFSGTDDESFEHMFPIFYEEALEIYNSNRSLGDQDSVNNYIAHLENICRQHFEEFSIRENQWMRKERKWEETKDRMINTAYGVGAGAATLAVAAKIVADAEAAKDGSRAVAHLIAEAVSATWASTTSEAVASTLTSQTAGLLSGSIVDATTGALSAAVVDATSEALSSAVIDATTEALSSAVIDATTEALSSAVIDATTEALSSAVIDATTEALSVAVVDTTVEATSAAVDRAASVVTTAIASESVGLANAAVKTASAALAGSSVIKTKLAVAALSGAALVIGPTVLAGPAAVVVATSALGVVPAACVAAVSGIKGVFSKLM